MIDGKLYNGKILEKKENVIVISHSGWLTFITPKKEFSYTGKLTPLYHLTLWGDNESIAWDTPSGSGFQIYKDGKTLWGVIRNVEEIWVSKNGYDTIALVKEGSGNEFIYKNGLPQKSLQKWYISWTFQTNGAHWIYWINQNGIKNSSTMILFFLENLVRFEKYFLKWWIIIYLLLKATLRRTILYLYKISMKYMWIWRIHESMTLSRRCFSYL